MKNLFILLVVTFSLNLYAEDKFNPQLQPENCKYKHDDHRAAELLAKGIINNGFTPYSSKIVEGEVLR